MTFGFSLDVEVSEIEDIMFSGALTDIYVDKFDQTSVNGKNACNFIM